MLFPSTIISGSPSRAVSEEISRLCQELGTNYNSNNPDLLVIDQTTGWAIDTVRDLIHFLSRRPIQHAVKVAIIDQAQNLSTEAQSVLLKTLEEPGEGNYLILTTPNFHSLLPTILSRCYLITLQSHSAKPNTTPVSVSTNPQINLASVDELLLSTDKAGVLDWFDNQIRCYQQELTKTGDYQTSLILQKLIKAKDMVNANVDPKSALDWFFLS